MSVDRSIERAAGRGIAALQSAANCLTAQHLVVDPVSGATEGVVTVLFSSPVSLRAPTGGPSGLFFGIVHTFGIDQADRDRPRQRMTTRRYEYRLLDHHREELLVYHWQPGSEFAGPDHPHLHVSAALDARIDALTRREIPLDKLHVATGHVSLETVIRMLITEFGVAPRRPNWRETLDRTEAARQDDAP